MIEYFRKRRESMRELALASALYKWYDTTPGCICCLSKLENRELNRFLSGYLLDWC